MDRPDNNADARSVDAVSRRAFAASSVAAGVVGSAGSTQAKAHMEKTIVETDVTITTPDGSCDAALFHAAEGKARPAVVMFPDALGLRPVFRDMGRRLAGDGHTVLVPNPFYRTRKAPVFGDDFDFSNPTDRAKLGPLRAPLTPEAVMRDGLAYVAFLDAHKAVDRKAKMGSVGYCMGGAMTMQVSAAAPTRFGAGVSMHGGGLVTDKPDSPHLLVPKLNAAYYFGIAANDDERDPKAKDGLKAAFAAANRQAKIEVYETAQHGWCVKGSPVYKEPDAERAWSEMLALYKRALV